MFCPRCGSGIDEGLKYCRNCGLPIGQISGYVASGGTKDLMQMSPAPPPLTRMGFTIKQVLGLRIAASLLLPAFVGMLASLGHWPDEVIGIAAVLAPFLILLSIFRYRAQAIHQAAAMDSGRQINASLPPLPPPPVLPMPAQKNTNPLNAAQPVSVIEDETVRFPEKS